ncbi:MAG: hypothetical protein ABID04_03905, partial [Patescibacteria group bacterium]
LANKKIIIPEAGIDPAKPIGERLQIALNFAKQLEARLSSSEIKNKFNIDSVSFLLMDDKTGKQYLIVKDADGNWVIMEYDSFNIIALSGQEAIITELFERVGIARGNGFEITKSVCWGNYDEAIQGALKALNTYVNHNTPVKNNFSGVLDKLLPPDEIKKNRSDESLGKMLNWEVCEAGTQDYWYPEGEIKYQVPAEYSGRSVQGVQLNEMLSPPKKSDSISNDDLVTWDQPLNSNQAGITQSNVFDKRVLGKSTEDHTNVCPNVGFRAWGENGKLCWEIQGDVGPTTHCDWGYRINLTDDSGNVTTLHHEPMIPRHCLTMDPKNGPPIRITCHDGNANSIPFPTNGKIDFEITTVRGWPDYDCRPDMHVAIGCKKVGDKIVCTDAQGNQLARPTPPPCQVKHNQGSAMPDLPTDTSGKVTIPINSGLSPETFMQALLTQLGVCRDIKFVFNFWTATSFTYPDESIQRETYNFLALPGKEYQAKDGETTTGVSFKASPEKQNRTEMDIFGQAGVQDAYKETIQLLSPPE